MMEEIHKEIKDARPVKQVIVFRKDLLKGQDANFAHRCRVCNLICRMFGTMEYL